jgi:threonine dehydratase
VADRTALPVTPADIDAAAARIAGHVRETPVIETEPGAFGLGHPVTFKLEYLQVTGTFKPRGMFNRILSAAVGPAGIAVASGGNAAIAACHAARSLGHVGSAFVPTISSPAKIDRLKALGADLHVVGDVYAETLAARDAHIAATGAVEVHAYDQPEVVAGQGTLARELESQVDLDTLLVAVGGGGLIGGIAAWYEGRVKVVAVETEGCAALNAALAAGKPVEVPVSGVAADSLGAPRAGDVMFPIAQSYVAEAVLVTDDAVIAARNRLWEELRAPVEHGAATALAALTAGAYVPEKDECVGIVLCGANTDLTTVGR